MKLNFRNEEKIVLGILSLLAIISLFLDEMAAKLFSAIQNDFLHYTLFPFSLSIGFFFPVLVLASFYFYAKRKKEGILPLWITFAVTFITTYALKFLFHRARPLGEMFTTVFSLPDYSFPSSHASLSFAILAVIDEEFKGIRKFWLIIAILVIISRMYFSYHYFSDVCFGALLGYGIGMIIVRISKKQKTKKIA